MSDSLPSHGLYSSWNSPGQNNGMGSCSLLQVTFPAQGSNPVSCIAGGFFTSWATREAKVCVLVTQLCLTLWDSMDCSSPYSSVHGILQARILEWVAVPFSRGSLATGSQVQTYLFPDSGGISHHSNMLTQNQWWLSSQTTALQKIRMSLCITSVKSERLQNVKKWGTLLTRFASS